MNKKIMYMFIILQMILIISNYQCSNVSFLSINLSDLLRFIILLFNSLYIFLIAKDNNKLKIVYASILFLTFIAYLFDNYSISLLLINYYYISVFSFIIFYCINNKINKFRIILLYIVSLYIFDIFLLFSCENGLYIELLLTLFLGSSLLLYNRFKEIIVPLYLITIIVSVLNEYNFVLYNSLVFITIILFNSNKKDLLFNCILLVVSCLCLFLNNSFTLKEFYQAFEIFSFNSCITTFVIVIPLIGIICYFITKSFIQKETSLEIKLMLYIAIIFVSLMTISLDNMYNEILLIFFSLFFILIIDYFKNNNKKLKEEITFFVLHLGYGGIESSTINSSNELSKHYKVNIVSLYNLKRNIENTIDKSISIKHLYNGEPNREELSDAIKKKNIIKIIYNGFKACYILFLRKFLIIKEMYYCDSKYVVSTRNEFSILLSEYGNKNAIKIAQEHMHHRDNKKYVDNIKYNFKNIDYMFALTQSLKNDYEKFLEKNKHTKVVVIPNIIYLPKKKSNLKNKNLITVSRLNSIKKIDDMIIIFNEIDNKKTKLFIVGDGDELSRLKALVDKLDLSKRVIFTGYKTKEEIEEYFLDSCLFLLTSSSEGLPMVLLESMSYGVPCIAFKTKSGVSDIIDNNVNGFIVEGRNKEKYIEKINDLLDNKKLLNEFSVNSLEKVKEFTSNKIIKKWQEVLKNEKEK